MAAAVVAEAVELAAAGRAVVAQAEAAAVAAGRAVEEQEEVEEDRVVPAEAEEPAAEPVEIPAG